MKVVTKVIGLVLLCAVLWACLTLPGHAQQPAKAASGPPVGVTLLVSSRPDACHHSADVAAATALATQEAARINRQGGVGGRPIVLRMLDDRREQAATIANLRTGLQDPDTLAIIGLSNSNRGKAAFDALGSDIAGSGIPFVSDISVASVFANAANVFTTRASQEAERMPVMAAFIKEMGFRRPAFVGRTGMVFSAAMGDGLRTELGALAADVRLAGDGSAPVEDGALRDAAASLKAAEPDVLALSVGRDNTDRLIAYMIEAGVTPALFVGRIDTLSESVRKSYPNAIYQLAWDQLPEVFPSRLRQRIDADPPGTWVFGGGRNDAAPGWASGACKPPERAVPDPFEAENMRAIGVGTQFADMLGLVATAANTAPRGSDLAARRAAVIASLASSYASGRGTFKGTFQNWSFDPATRSAARTPFVVILPKGLGRTQLAPVQFVRVRPDRLRRVDTLYLDIDLVRAHRIEDSEKTFFAEFYVSMRENGRTKIGDIEFANAYLDPKTNGRQITVEALNADGSNDAFPDQMRVFKVTGRFLFEPDLANYPLDTQRFAIDLQPRRSNAPFIVQPPPEMLRDATVETDGWEAKAQYVGHDEDFIPLLDAFTHEPSLSPFYTASFSWLMKRQTTDYILRVVVPLAFILIVAYLSIFIPESHFEAIVTIQVTALLSAVALYLSIPQLGSDTATLSDKVFVFDYVMVSLMIVITILRVNRHVARRKWLHRSLGVLHIAAVPALVVVMIWYVYDLSSPTLLP